jgi:hypothetical protein
MLKSKGGFTQNNLKAKGFKVYPGSDQYAVLNEPV